MMMMMAVINMMAKRTVTTHQQDCSHSVNEPEIMNRLHQLMPCEAICEPKKTWIRVGDSGKSERQESTCTMVAVESIMVMRVYDDDDHHHHHDHHHYQHHQQHQQQHAFPSIRPTIIIIISKHTRAQCTIHWQALDHSATQPLGLVFLFARLECEHISNDSLQRYSPLATVSTRDSSSKLDFMLLVLRGGVVGNLGTKINSCRTYCWLGNGKSANSAEWLQRTKGDSFACRILWSIIVTSITITTNIASGACMERAKTIIICNHSGSVLPRIGS